MMDLPPDEARAEGVRRGVDKVLAWLDSEGLSWLTAEYVRQTGEAAGAPQPPRAPYVPKLTALAPPSPEVVLHRTLAKLDHIATVALVVKWRADGTFAEDHSLQRSADLAAAAVVLQAAAAAALRGA